MKATRKLIPALAMLVVAAVVMSTASFAWFSMSREVSALGMDVTVTAPNNLLIKGAEEADTAYAAEKDLQLASVALEPASTVNGTTLFSVKDGEALNVQTGALFNDTELRTATPASVGTLGGYMDFEYTIKTEGDAVDVYVKEFTLTVTKENQPDANMKAFRMAIIVGDPANPESVKIVNIGTGVNHTADSAVSALTAGNLATITAIPDANIAEAGGATAAARDVVLSLAAGEAKDVTIRIWVEGEDTTCTAAIASGIAGSLDVVFADVNYEVTP